jgi:type II secretory pathway component GspD/PulD (secretin)
VNQIMRSRLDLHRSKSVWPWLLAGCIVAATADCRAQSKAAGSGEEQPATASETTARPQSPPRPPNPQELEVRPADDGTLRFNFQGQPWPDVLEWLAEVSHLSLDWQELPAGFLNLRTQRSYSVDEARDLLNRHLLDRGFTLLKHGEILSVVNVKKLDPSLIPRLEADELDEAQPHDFVRVSFNLDWLLAETAVEELKPLVSPNGKLTALKSTNRLEAIDAVTNLRQIRKLLTDEQSSRGRERLVREFKLQHVKATEVQPQLQKLLGLDKGSGSPGGDPAAIAQQVAQLMQKAGAAPGQAQPGKQQPPPVYLVANARDNSILAHAPADQMAVIAEAIQVIDNPSDKSRSLLRNTHRVQVYPLAVADPDALVKMLQELGDLAPETRLQVDKKHRAIVAHANLTDHLTIRTLVDKLDGTVRNFRVIPLRRLDADYVAGSIDLVMGGGDNTKRPPNRDPEDESRRFRVVADVEKNRLLLWVNDDELANVRELLSELGEVPGEGNAPSTAVRVLDTAGPAEAEELLRRLQKVWPGIAPNRLELGPGAKSAAPATPDAEVKPQTGAPASDPNQPSTKRPTRAASNSDPGLRSDKTTRTPGRNPLRLVLFGNGDAEPSDRALAAAENAPPADRPADETGAASSAADAPAPVRIDRDADGKLIITSEDAAALESLRKLVAEMAPTAKDFHVFRMKHKTTWAYSVSDNLKQFFEERQKAEEKQKSEKQMARFYDPVGGKWINSPREEENRRQQKRRQPRFIVDMDSNSILAVGADAEQIKVIGELIELYDTPAQRDAQAVRITRLIRVKHGQARQVAETVKEVYRDLLSVNESREANGQRPQRPSESTYTFVYNSAAGGAKPETLARFKGLLSIGLDEVSNGLVVSAPEALLENVEATIATLDEAARASTPRVQVLRVDRSVDTADLQKRLLKAIAKPQQAGTSQRQ